MAFNGHYVVSQTANIQEFIITDDSTGSDVNLTGRTISLFLADGSLLGGATIDWPLAEGATKTIDLLARDYSISIKVDWASSAPLPSPSTYTLTELFTFSGNSNTFIYSLVQQLAALPSLNNDTTFYQYLSQLQTEVDSAVIAGSYDDQGAAQSCLDRAYAIIINQANYF
jgi:hypothetical protein